jgi:hypothetical protein
MDGVLYKYTYNNNHNKFIDFINYITLEPSSFLYNREKYIESFCHIQKIYHAFIKFKNVFKFKYLKKYDLDQDLLGNDLNDIKSNYKIKLIESNTIYEFSIRDLLKNIHLSLTNNSQFFFEPINPINPYTGLEFSTHNLYNIYFAYKNTYLKTQTPFEYYFICGFNMKNYTKYSEGLVNKDMIRVNVKNMDIATLKLNIFKIFRYYGYKNIYLSDDFPKERIRDIFTPYVELYTYINFGQDQNRIFWSRKLLKQQVKRFVNYMNEHNPLFGRVIRKINKEASASGKRTFKRIVQDDHVRWDPHFPYIRETKDDENNIFGQYLSNTNNLPNPTVSDSDNNESDDSDDETVDEIPTPIINNSFNNSYISTFQNISRSASIDIDSDIDASNNDISNNDPVIDNDESLRNYMNDTNNLINPINAIHNNIIANSLLTRVIQIRMTNLNNSSDVIFSLLDDLIRNQIKIIAGKLLIKYLSNRLTDTMRERILNEITSDSSDPTFDNIVTNLQGFHDNISIETENDLSNNDL